MICITLTLFSPDIDHIYCLALKCKDNKKSGNHA